VNHLGKEEVALWIFHQVAGQFNIETNGLWLVLGKHTDKVPDTFGIPRPRTQLRYGRIIDVDDDNPGTSAVTRTLTVPTGVKVLAYISVGGYTGSNSFTTVISALDISDQAGQAYATAALSGFPASGAQSGAGNGWSFDTMYVRTNTSAQIRSRLSASGASDRLGIVTRGWIDDRGRGA